MEDTYCPQDLDALVAQTRLLTGLGARGLRAWSVDFANANKTIGLRARAREAALVFFVDPTTNVPHKAQILAHPFGSRRAPADWGEGRYIPSVRRHPPL